MEREVPERESEKERERKVAEREKTLLFLRSRKEEEKRENGTTAEPGSQQEKETPTVVVNMAQKSRGLPGGWVLEKGKGKKGLREATSLLLQFAEVSD